MATVPNEDCYIFIVKTNLYSGNFERELCAYITGEVGECGVGDNFAERYRHQVPEQWEGLWENRVFSVPDEHGCHRPASIWTDASNEYTSVAVFLHDRPSDTECEFLVERARKFPEALKAVKEWACEGDLKILGFELIKYDVKRTESVVAEWS